MAQAEIDTSTRSQTGQRTPPRGATRWQVNFRLPSSPCVGVRIRGFPFSADSSRWR